MGTLDLGSGCCCGLETFTVFGPRWTGGGWDDPGYAPSSITIKYSFMQEGCPMVGGPESGGLSQAWEFPLGQITEGEFKSQIRGALEYWRVAFEKEFPWMTLNFVDLGTEAGLVQSFSNHSVDTDDNRIGDIRFGVELLPPGVLAHAYLTTDGEPLGTGSHQKDVHFNPNEHWRLDGTAYRGTKGEEEGTTISSGEGLDAARTSEKFWTCSLCSEEERALHGHQTPGWSDEEGASILWVAVHELGHVFGLSHTDPLEIANENSILWSKIHPDKDIATDAPALDAATLVSFRATYGADDVDACVSSRGLIDICQSTVDESGGLEAERTVELEESPAHLLGTVYYSRLRRYDSATTQGLCSIEDTLNSSSFHFGGPSPVCKGTVTTWGEHTLYILSSTNAVQKVDLSDSEYTPPKPVAQWWVYGEDFRVNYNYSGNADPFAFKPEDLRVSLDVSKPDIVAIAKEVFWPVYALQIGLGRPSGLGWDSSLNERFISTVTSERTNLQVNPRGEFLTEPDGNIPFSGTDHGTFPFRFDCGYGDPGIGFIAEISDESPEVGRYTLNPNETPIDSYVDTLGLGKVDPDGDALFHPPGHEIQRGWVNPGSGPWASKKAAPIMTDVSFLASEGSVPTKVIPQIIARNSWPYAAGGYTTIDSEAMRESSEVIVLATLDMGWAERIVGDATKTVAGLGAVKIWPPRVKNTRHSEEEPPGECAAYDTFTEVGDKIVAKFSGVDGVWKGDSVLGGEGSTLTLFGARDIGEVASSGAYPSRIPETIDGEDVRGECSIRGSTYGQFDFADYSSWTGILIGYWKIKRKVGVWKHRQKTHLVTGEVAGSDGVFPHIVTEGATTRVLSTIDFYDKFSGQVMPGSFELEEDLVETDFPWALQPDFPSSPTAQTPYMREELIRTSGGGAGRGVAHGSATTGLPRRSSIGYYNRTSSTDVFLVQVETQTPGIDPPKFFSKVDLIGGADPSFHGAYHSFAKYTEGTSTGASPALTGGPTYTFTGDISPSSGYRFCNIIKTPDPVAQAVYPLCPTGGYVKDINTYDRWSAGGGWLFPSSSSGFDLTGLEYTTGLGLYPRLQLWFGDTVIYDTMETMHGFEQTILAEGPGLNNWTLSPDGRSLAADDAVSIYRRGYPRTELDSIEVLPGNGVAILTTVLKSGAHPYASTITQGPQTLTVFKDGTKLWSVEAAGDFGPYTGFSQAKIVTASDHWVHVIGFPLNVQDATRGKIKPSPEGRATKPVFTSWLFDINLGTIKVPARIDEVDVVLPIGSRTRDFGMGGPVQPELLPPDEPDNASWATLWSHLGLAMPYYYWDISNFDSPRKSSVIDDAVPRTMHPDEFF